MNADTTDFDSMLVARALAAGMAPEQAQYAAAKATYETCLDRLNADRRANPDGDRAARHERSGVGPARQRCRDAETALVRWFLDKARARGLPQMDVVQGAATERPEVRSKVVALAMRLKA